MYAQITTRCSMSCPHCCFSCGPVGADMTLRTFRAALDLFPGVTVTLGGGEPTLHPLFWEFVDVALRHPSAPFVEVITNGSQTETTLRLAGLAKAGVIGCTLSLDHYHGPIDPEVVEAFQVGVTERRFGDVSRDAREVRDVSDGLIQAGRASAFPSAGPGCPCPDHFLSPEGVVRYCGCADSPVVSWLQPRARDAAVWAPDLIPQLFSGRCYREALPGRPATSTVYPHKKAPP